MSAVYVWSSRVLRGSGLYTVLGRARFVDLSLAARLSLCVLSVLHRVVSDATMSTPGVAGTTLGKASPQSSRARPTGFYRRVGAPKLQDSDPSLAALT